MIEDKVNKTKAKPDFTIGRKKYQAELIPPALIIARYYAPVQAEIQEMERQLATIQKQIEEVAEERRGEGGLLEDADDRRALQYPLPAGIREGAGRLAALLCTGLTG